MSRLSKNDAFTHSEVRIYDTWQAIRRRDGYREAVKACLKGVKAWQAHINEQLAALGPEPPPPLTLSDPRLWGAWDTYEFLQYVKRYIPDRDAMSAEECMCFLDEAYAYKQRINKWSQLSQKYRSQVDACRRVLQASRQVSDFLNSLTSEQHSALQDELGFHPREPLGRDLFFCCKKVHDLIPALIDFTKQWKILFPLSPDLPAPPLGCTWIFPETSGYTLSRHWKTDEPQCITVAVMGHEANKGDIVAHFTEELEDIFGALRPSVLNRKQRREFDRRRHKWHAYDLYEKGMIYTDIAKEIWPDEYQQEKDKYEYPNKGKNPITQRARELVQAARDDLNKTQAQS